MARPKDLDASSAEEEASAQAAPEAAAKARERTGTGIQPPDPAKQSAYPLRDTAGWPTGRGTEQRVQAERKERDKDPESEPEKDPESLSTQHPIQDRTGVVAPPTAGEQPGASGELEGTPSAPAAGPGRQLD